MRIDEKTLTSNRIRVEVASVITWIRASHCGSLLSRGNGKKINSVSRPSESRKANERAPHGRVEAKNQHPMIVDSSIKLLARFSVFGPSLVRSRSGGS